MNELRLHLAEDRRKVSEPDIALALQHRDEINSNPRQWASLEINQFENYRNVLLHIGNIHTNGQKESASVTRSYSIWDGEVVINVQVHA